MCRETLWEENDWQLGKNIYIVKGIGIIINIYTDILWEDVIHWGLGKHSGEK